MSIRTNIIILLVIIGVPLQTYAAKPKGKPEVATSHAFSYNYIEAGFTDNDNDDGIQFRGSYLLNNNVFFSGAFSSLDNSDVLKLGAGYRFKYNNKVDFYGRAGFTDYEVDDGIELTGGVRGKLDENFEFGGGVNFFNGDNSDTQIFFNSVFSLNDKIDFAIEFQSGDLDITYISGRFIF